MRKEEIACIIVSYNIGFDLYKCYNSIKNQVDKVIIVDNGSDSDTIKALIEIKNEVNTQVLFLKKNMGIAKALNEGVKIAQNQEYNWIITMDNDSQATDSMIRNMQNVYNNLKENEKDKIVSLAPVFIEAKSEFVVSDIEERYSYEDLVITSGNIVKTSVFKEIGYFEEKYFIDYVDNESCLRVIESGKKIIQIKNAILKHNLGSTVEKKVFSKIIKSTNHSPARRYYLTRNALDVRERYAHLNIRHINNTRRILLRFIMEILLVEDNKLDKIKFMFKGYRDYKKNIYGEIKRNN